MAREIYSNRSYFGALYKSARQNAILIMTTDGVIKSINSAFTRCFGFAESELIGKNFSTLFTQEQKNDGLPERELSRVIHEGQSFDNNYMVDKNQAITWISGESLLVKNSKNGNLILKIVQNIHERKLSELELSHRNHFNESILGSIEDVVIVLDEKMNVVKTNNAFSNLFKSSVSDIEPLNFSRLIKPYDKNDELFIAVQKTISENIAFSNKQIKVDVVAVERVFDVSCIPIKGTSDLKFLLVVHDITVLKQLEREREDIMGFVAHELRNPLSNIILCNEVMREAAEDRNFEVITDMLARNKTNISRLQRMVSELYEATIATSGQLSFEITRFNFRDLVKEAIETVEVLQSTDNIIVTGDGDIMVEGDRHRLIQVITNFLSNGIKYSKDAPNLTLSVHYDKVMLTVAVTDHGIGISKEKLPFVFERFYRVEKTRKVEGIGLGLYLCRQIIDAHNGHIWAESEEGKGSSFYFSIPLHHSGN
jgi:PAS domain S-box-containing protein